MNIMDKYDGPDRRMRSEIVYVSPVEHGFDAKMKYQKRILNSLFIARGIKGDCGKESVFVSLWRERHGAEIADFFQKEEGRLLLFVWDRKNVCPKIFEIPDGDCKSYDLLHEGYVPHSACGECA